MTMQDNMLKLAVMLAVIVMLSLSENLLDAECRSRGRQAPLLYIAVIYIAAGMAVLSVNYDWGQKICSLGNFLQNAETAVLNVLLMVPFLLIKCILRPMITSKGKKDKVLKTASCFYEYDEAYHEWFLKKRWAGFRDICGAFRICCIIMTTGLLAVTWIGNYGTGTWLLCFPCATLLLINEAWGFINGMLREEFTHDVSGEEADARKVGNFSWIREIYEDLFAGQMLASHTGCEFSARKGASWLLEEMGRSDDIAERTAAIFFNSYPEKKIFDVDCIRAVSNIMHGKSILFFNPFYRDLGVYLTLPVIETLMKGRKCLLIAGRSSTASDAVPWLTELLGKYSHVRSLWTTKELQSTEPECEIGILRFQRIYDVDVLAANREFFREVGFVLFMEPSIMLNTGQVGISIIAEELCRGGNAPVYCICDRYADGLLDTMSHLLRTEITDVAPISVPRCMYTGMAWNVDGDFLRRDLFDKQTRFLGNGIELAAAAIKNQVPRVVWYGEKKAPLKDIKWIAGQYFPTICRYMNLPAQQESLYEKIRFIPDLWRGDSENEQFVIVEDEFCNMFSMMRTFLSRGKEQAFVNVLSENYLLRDYMRCNQQMFLSNPDAIPSFMPDYAKTERNTILKLIVLMAIRPVSEDEAAKELQLAGCKAEDTFDAICRLLQKYTQVDGSIFDLKSVTEATGSVSAHKVIYYSISRGIFEKYFAATLRTAYYIVEEEKYEDEFIDAKMFGHVAQTILPGQFVTYNGKYYEARKVSPYGGIILRRASSLYLDRRYYRQLRTYHFESIGEKDAVYVRKVMDVEIAVLCRSFTVSTQGYLDMDDNHDLRMARIVRFEGDPSADDYNRTYRNKNILQIRLPETDDKIRFTLCLLLSEIFRSIFPDAWQYLAVLAKRPEDIDGVLNHMVYTLSGDIDDDFVYVVEDSDLDLGLLDAVVRNLRRILEITADFLDWHFEKMREPEQKDPQAPSVVKKPEEARKRTMFLRMADRIRQLFGGHEENIKIESIEAVESKVDQQETEAEGKADQQDTETEGQGKKEGQAAYIHEESSDEMWLDGNADAELFHVDGTDIFEDEGVPEDNEWIEESLAASGIVPIRKTRYQEECYLKFGFEEMDGRLRIEDVRNYLHLRGYCNNTLTKARKWKAAARKKLDLTAANCCDFCNLPLSGVSFERLNDGRVRCNDCSSTAITTVEELRDIFYRVLEMMELFYGISFPVQIHVNMADANTIAKGYGSVFTPSTQYASRVLGYAQKDHGKYSLFIENGSPRLATIDTMVHELTHIWQYLNWDKKETANIYRMRNSSCAGRAEDIVYEGMAVWASIQYMHQIGETYYAEIQEEMLKERKEMYGIGFSLYNERYPLVKDLSLMKYTPFRSFPPLDPEEVRRRVKDSCTEEVCIC